MSLITLDSKKKSGKSKTPLKKHNVEIRRSPRKRKESREERGRRKLDFDKDGNIKRDRLKGFVVYVDVQAPSKQKEIKERIRCLGGKIEEFLDKGVNLIVTNQKASEKQDGRLGENSPLSGTGPSPLPQSVTNKQSIAYSPCSTDSLQNSVEFLKKERIMLSLGQKLVNRVKRSGGSRDIRETAKLIGAKIISSEDFTRKYMNQNLPKDLKSKPLHKLKRKSSGSRLISDIQVSQVSAPFFKIEDETCAFRPIIHEFKIWPKLQYNTSLVQSPFDIPKVGKSKMKYETPKAEDIESKDEETLSIDIKSAKKSELPEEPKKELPKMKEVQKDGEKTGYCDCCSLRYKDLKKHLKSDHHRKFALDSKNFKELDKLIHQGNDFRTFFNDLKAAAKIQNFNRDFFMKTNNSSDDSPTTSSIALNKITVENSHFVSPNRIVLGENVIDGELPIPFTESPSKFLCSTLVRSLLLRSRISCPLSVGNEIQEIHQSPLRRPEEKDIKTICYPKPALSSVLATKEILQTSSPVNPCQQSISTVTTSLKHSILHKPSFKKDNSLCSYNYENLQANDIIEARETHIDRTPNKDTEIRRKVKRRKSRKSSHRSSQSQTANTIQDEIDDEKCLLTTNQQTNEQKNDPYISFNTKDDPLIEVLLSPKQKSVGYVEVNKTPVNNVSCKDVSLNSTCELTKRPDDEVDNEMDSNKNESLKSFIEENFSNESMKENIQPDFLGFDEDSNDVFTVLPNEQSGNNYKKYDVMFSDDAGEDHTQLDGTFSFQNVVKIEEFCNVDDVSVAILKNGSTPKSQKTTRSRLNKDNELSPVVTHNLRRTPRRSNCAAEVLKSPSTLSGLNLRSHIPQKEEKTPKKLRQESKKRSITTPNSGRCRKRSRTNSQTSNSTVTLTHDMRKSAKKSLDHPNERSTEQKTDGTLQITHKKSSTKTEHKFFHESEDLMIDEVFEKTTCASKDAVKDHELAKILSLSLYDRLKKYDRKVKSCNSQSSSRSNSPHKRRTVSEKSDTSDQPARCIQRQCNSLSLISIDKNGDTKASEPKNPNRSKHRLSNSYKSVPSVTTEKKHSKKEKTAKRKNGRKTQMTNSRLRRGGPFGDPRNVGKITDQDAAAILEDFDAVDSQHNSSLNDSLGLSDKCIEVKLVKHKKSTGTPIDDDDDFDNFIPVKHRRPKMIR